MKNIHHLSKVIIIFVLASSNMLLAEQSDLNLIKDLLVGRLNGLKDSFSNIEYVYNANTVYSQEAKEYNDGVKKSKNAIKVYMGGIPENSKISVIEGSDGILLRSLYVDRDNKKSKITYLYDGSVTLRKNHNKKSGSLYSENVIPRPTISTLSGLKIFGGDRGYLSNLLQNSDYNVSFGEINLQKLSALEVLTLTIQNKEKNLLVECDFDVKLGFLPLGYRRYDLRGNLVESSEIKWDKDLRDGKRPLLAFKLVSHLSPTGEAAKMEEIFTIEKLSYTLPENYIETKEFADRDGFEIYDQVTGLTYRYE